MSLDNANSFFKHESEPERREFDVSIFSVYDLESFYIVRALPYCVSFYRLIPIIVLLGTDSFSKTLE